MAKKAASLIGFLTGVMFWTSASADAYLVDPAVPANILIVEITGQITQRDVAFFRSLSKDFEIKQLVVWPDSFGGDVYSAMEIGRIIRSVDGWTIIRPQDRCYSSCALVFIAGASRTNSGQLGLHHRYLAAAPLSREQLEMQVPIVRSDVKKYVQEMGVTDTFFERMFNTDPSEIEVYRGIEKPEKIVPARDAVWDEIDTSVNARR